MKILYLVDKSYFENKMSRVRFQSMDAIAKITDVKYSGNGWPGYDSNSSVADNVQRLYRGVSLPDLVIAYKPMDLNNFRHLRLPKCIRYNEMYDFTWTTREIIQSGAGLVICHHKNDIQNYEHICGVKFANISHCAEKTIYRDYGLPKVNDVLLVGAIDTKYPFRRRLHNLIITKLGKLCKCKVLKWPGGDLRNPQGPILHDYAKEINQSKVTLTCSSKYKYRLGKYVEIPMCASLLAADLPDEDHDFFRKFMCVLDPDDSDEVLIEKIMHYVTKDDERNELIQQGLLLNREYTQEKYAERFLKVVNCFLADRK